MLEWQETKKLAIYKHDFSCGGIILKAVYCQGNKKGSVADPYLQIRGEWVGGGGGGWGLGLIRGSLRAPPPGSATGVSLSRVWYCKGFTVYCLQRINCEYIRLCFQLLSFLWKQRGKFSKLSFSYY